jgi:hypothetical protein
LSKLGMLAVIVSVAALAWAGHGSARPREATALMEQFAGKAEHARKIHPDTANVIARLVSQPSYDCNRVVCGEPLRARNRVVRARLKMLVADKTPVNEVPGAREADASPIGTEDITTGSTGSRKPK